MPTYSHQIGRGQRRWEGWRREVGLTCGVSRWRTFSELTICNGLEKFPRRWFSMVSHLEIDTSLCFALHNIYTDASAWLYLRIHVHPLAPIRSSKDRYSLEIDPTLIFPGSTRQFHLFPHYQIPHVLLCPSCRTAAELVVAILDPSLVLQCRQKA